MFLTIFAVASATAALVMSVVTWRIVRDDRRRTAVRVARLAADIHRDEGDEASAPSLGEAPRAPGMFASAESQTRVYKLGATALAGVLVVGAAAALVVVASGSHSRKPEPQARTAVVPLELLSLQHERDIRGLTIRGTVRNPEGGAIIDHLSAVVLLLGPDGDFISSERVEVAGEALAPGDETTFVVTVPDADRVGRYRVSFRADDRTIPHVDRRT